jgi:hypothetical protein
MKKTFLLFLVVLILMALPGSALAQTKAAKMVGYEKVNFVTGKVYLSSGLETVYIMDLTSVYDHPLEIYLAKGFDQQGSLMVGQVLPGPHDQISFNAPEGITPDVDTVLIMVPGWSVPVAVGLLQ